MISAKGTSNLMKNCIVCEKELVRTPSKIKKVTGKHSVTCSRKCSQIYLRISNYHTQRRLRMEEIKKNG